MTAWTHSVPRILQRITKYIFCYIYRVIGGGGGGGWHLARGSATAKGFFL